MIYLKRIIGGLLVGSVTAGFGYLLYLNIAQGGLVPFLSVMILGIIGFCIVAGILALGFKLLGAE